MHSHLAMGIWHVVALELSCGDTATLVKLGAGRVGGARQIAVRSPCAAPVTNGIRKLLL